MLKWIMNKVVGSRNQRILKTFRPLVAEINQLEEELQKLPESVLQQKTAEWQQLFKPFHNPNIAPEAKLARMEVSELREIGDALNKQLLAIADHLPGFDTTVLSGSESTAEEFAAAITAAKERFLENEEKFPAIEEKLLNDILPEAFAVVKNGARRLCGQSWDACDTPVEWNMVHFDVQLMGGIGLHRGLIAEMQTGEGKTLVATLPVYLRALTGRGVHVITVNDYLARRDSEWVGYLYKFLGLTVGCIQNQQPPSFRREQYECDITYGTNSEFGFDYLRDNGMATSKAEQVQRGHYFAIIDEVDSILIDEARTPLIISGPVTTSTQQFDQYKPLVEQLVRKQNVLVNETLADAKKAIEAEDLETAGLLLYKVKCGQPRNRGLARLMEEPEIRRAIDKAELTLLQDTKKKAMIDLKEELYFSVDEKGHDADLTEMGRQFLNPDDPDAFMLPDLATEFAELDARTDVDDAERAQLKEELQQRLDHQGMRIHSITQLVKAYTLFEKDVSYVVTEGKVVIVDENTGREMPGRRWSDGLHQAVEAKEGVTIDKETQTLATITIQNYFRMYEKLAGMTGTAETEAAEFHDIYKLDVLVVPTNRPSRREDENDRIFKTRREKFNAVIGRIKEAHAAGQPVLVGTASVDASETLGRMLKREKIPHAILNAKHHRQEAEIVARAGQPGAVTVATNMAGRGTDIKLGPGVDELGGLLVLGTERHESRRIDRQLRGRCARQGDAGQSVFYLSFEDDLMRNFGASERMTSMMERFGMEEGEELQHPLLNRSVETAQKRVEQRNYTIRKRVLEYDDVMNQQRQVVYTYRNEIIESERPRDLIYELIEEAVPARVSTYLFDDADAENPNDYEGLMQWVNSTFPLRMTQEEADFENKSVDEASQFIIDQVRKAYDLKVAHENEDVVEELERYIVLSAVDKLWQEHLYSMDSLREGIHLRSQGQKDPLVEYKKEAYELFDELMGTIQQEALGNLFRSTTNLQQFEQFLQSLPTQLSGAGLPDGGIPQPASDAPAEPAKKLSIGLRKAQPRVGRNDDCPCGSGKKFKSCCGRTA
ncbi:preprotein translocase subunit SecA [Sulfuriroseicoccus oceanibius]|uniref:Protein translocase subunit SecA n=1 Tax=Sulfuriroseicoccus oceanibius TaxID=2707525 RepID=A0A6B3L9V1_9BACT|nr:preprotein translocase subunit SecA [Sulfuriroseicoccus oceanibius]QQL44459.1 preprotein translocase subunit SecA [Sulfuriroseicoccus oceanibius]